MAAPTRKSSLKASFIVAGACSSFDEEQEAAKRAKRKREAILDFFIIILG